MAVELQEVVTLFHKADSDNDGAITCDEFKQLLHSLEPQAWNDDVLNKLFTVADADKSGTLDVKEFLDWTFGVMEDGSPVQGKITKVSSSGAESLSVDSTADTAVPLEAELSLGLDSVDELSPGVESRDGSSSSSLGSIAHSLPSRSSDKLLQPVRPPGAPRRQASNKGRAFIVKQTTDLQDKGLEEVHELEDLLEHEDSSYTVIPEPLLEKAAGRAAQSLDLQSFKKGATMDELSAELSTMSQPLDSMVRTATTGSVSLGTSSASAMTSRNSLKGRMSRTRSSSKQKPAAGTSSEQLAAPIKPILQDEPVTSLEEVYELMTMRAGRITGKLELEDLMEIFVECKADGLTTRLVELVPQTHDGVMHGVPEDVTPFELAALVGMIVDEPEADEADARLCVAQVEDSFREIDASKREARRAGLVAMNLDYNLPIGFGMFNRLLEFLTALMHLDQQHLLVSFAYARTGRFEMTKSLQITMLREVFLKCKKGNVEVQDQGVTYNDFVAACSNLDLADNSWKTGVPREELGLLYGQVMRHMQTRLDERHEKRYRDRCQKKKPKLRSDVKVVAGRTELSILVEELFKTLPMNRSRYRSPLNLILSLLEKRRESDVAAASDDASPTVG